MNIIFNSLLLAPSSGEPHGPDRNTTPHLSITRQDRLAVF